MASPSVVTTPLHHMIHTPETPHFGFDDNYQPYSPRFSKHTPHRTQPQCETSDNNIIPAPKNRQTRSFKIESESLQLPITSNVPTQCFQTARKKPKLEKTHAELRRNKTPNNSTSKVQAIDDHVSSLPPLNSKSNRRSPASCCLVMGMLMTPTKTPMKRNKKNPAPISSVSRMLFPSELASHESLSSPLTKETSEVTPQDASVTPDAKEEAQCISIFTDSRDRIPEIDLTPNNPFFLDKNAIQRDSSKTSSKPINILVQGEGLQTSDKLVGREDGLIYNFRGKVIFRKFDKRNEPIEEDEVDLSGNDTNFLSHNLHQPISRNIFKPRLLFPSIPKPTFNQRKEYITKELGDGNVAEDSSLTENPTKEPEEKFLDPLTPKFQSASPDTFITSRATQKIHDPNDRPIRTLRISKQEPGKLITLGPRSIKKARPFASWKCTKPLAERTRKRGAEPLSRDSPDKKIKL